MLSDGEIYRVFVATADTVQGLRAVEAAVCADQIEKDAEIAQKYWPASPSWAHDVATAIRAQLPVTDPGEQLLRDIFTGGLDTEKEDGR